MLEKSRDRSPQPNEHNTEGNYQTNIEGQAGQGRSYLYASTHGRTHYL
jgi:hypothetical protein